MDDWTPKDPAEVRAMLDTAVTEMQERANCGDLPDGWQPDETGPLMSLIITEDVEGVSR